MSDVEPEGGLVADFGHISPLSIFVADWLRNM